MSSLVVNVFNEHHRENVGIFTMCACRGWAKISFVRV